MSADRVGRWTRSRFTESVTVPCHPVRELGKLAATVLANIGRRGTP